MKKHLLSTIVSSVICALLLIGCGGGGGGGGGTPAPSEQTEFIYSTEANGNGTFRLTSQKSGAVIESSEDGTLATGSSIVLTERLAKSNESKLYGGNSSNIYTLQAKSDNKTVKKLDKPIILTIPNNFSKEFKTFFLGSRSETASDWQYTQILDDNDTNPTIVKTARLAVKDLNTFKIKTFRLSYSFAIFASKDNGEDKPTNSDSVKLMTFSVDPIKVYYDKSSKYITDIKVSSCITANKSSALFDGSEVTSQLVFFNSSSADVSGLKIDGSTAVQTSSTDKDSSNNQYSHTLYIKSYKKNNIAISGNNATYTFELKLTGISTKDFPDSFRVKTVLKDANGTEFASEGSVKLKKEKEPEKIDTETNTSTGTNTNTRTSTNTSTGTSTNTKTSTGTSTNTKTSTGTSTNTKTNTSTDTGSGTNTQTDTATGSATSTDTSTNTSSSTSTQTNTQTTTNTNTSTSTGSSTSTQTQTSTNTQTATNTNTGSSTSTQTQTNTSTNTGSSTSTQTQTNTQTNTQTTTNTNTSTDTGTLTTTEISVSITPTNSETTKVEVTTPIKITFNEKMDKNQNLLTLVTLICNSTTTNLITASNQLEWSTENNKDVLTVKNIKLNPEQSYTIKLNSGLKTESGLTSTNQISSNFVTRDAVTLSITTPSAQNVAVTSKIEITPSSGSISSVANASISFGSNSKTGSFSIQNGKAYFTLTSGTTWNPETIYSGSISGLLDSDGCETKSCNFSFTTRNKVVLNTTNLTSQNAPLNTKIEITPTGGTISNIENATINFNSEGKAGSFSIQNGKVYFTLSSGTTWNPETYYAGTISGILDSDSCETKTCSFSFTTRAQTTLSFQSQNSYNARSNLSFTVNNGSITDLSTANIGYSGGSINCSLSFNNGNILCSLGENAQWAFDSNSTITISDLKDTEGAPVADSEADFYIGSQPYLSCDNSSIKANGDLVFALNGSTITSLTNANVSFTGANVNGNLQLVNGKVVYKLANNSLYPFGSNGTIKISGLKDSNGVTIANLSQDFYTEAQTEIDSFTKSENLRDNISLSYSGGFTGWNVSNATAVFDNANVSGTFSIENGKILYKLNTGYNYPPSTTVTGKISGIKDADGLPVKDCNVSFETRQAVVLSSQLTNESEELYPLNQQIVINATNNLGEIQNVSIILNSGSAIGSFNLENNSQVVFTPSSVWATNSTISGKITGIKDFEGITLSDCNFSFKTRKQSVINLSEPESTVIAYRDDKLKFKIVNAISGYIDDNELCNGNLNNISITFDNCNINGQFSISNDGNNYVVFTPNSNQLWPSNTTVTGTISNITQNDGGTVPEYSFSFKTHYLAGKGTQEEPWLVSTPEDLYNLRNVKYGNGGIYESIPFFKQTQNIDLSDYGQSYDNGKGWKPIFNYEDDGGLNEDFYGYYNGNNYKITNLYINRPNENVGLFNIIRGKITNLGIEISNGGITGTEVGGISSSIYFDSGYGQSSIEQTVKNCWVKGNGTISCSQLGGGLFGTIGLGINIENCYSDINLEGSGSNVCVGGLIGKTNGGEITNCYSKGTINSNGAAGGLIGTVEESFIKSSYSNSSVNCASSGGGLIACINGGNVENCYATGNVIGTGNLSSYEGIGGLLGYIIQAQTINNCYSTGNVKGNGYISGIIGYYGGSFNCSVSNCFTSSLEVECGSTSDEVSVNRIYNINDNYQQSIVLNNCYANKNMTLVKNGVSSQPGLQEPLPETVALDGVDGANLPDNPDWKNDIFKDGYENGESFDSVWEIGTSGLPILKNMPGNPEQ